MRRGTCEERTVELNTKGTRGERKGSREDEEDILRRKCAETRESGRGRKYKEVNKDEEKKVGELCRVTETEEKLQ